MWVRVTFAYRFPGWNHATHPDTIPAITRASPQMIGQCPKILENIAGVVKKGFATCRRGGS
jgi:hypothetical protein